MSSLKLDMKVGDTLLLDGNRVRVTLLDKSGQRARLDITADDDVKISTQKAVDYNAVVKKGLNMK